MVASKKAQEELEKVVWESSAKELEQKSESEEIQDLLKGEEEQAKEPKKKPNIDALKDAVVFLDDGTPTFVPQPGERVIIERYTSLLPGRPWLDTRVYMVRGVDPETGHLDLWDEETQHWVSSNFADGLRNGYKFKCQPLHGRGIPKKRHRRTKEERETAKLEALERKAKSKKTRGRPKGSKNRDKATIQAEKIERAKVRAEKAAKRDLRKRIAQAAVVMPVRTVAGEPGKKRRSRKNDVGRIRRVPKRAK